MNTTVSGSGKMASEDRNVSGFSAVAVSGVGTVRIEQAGAESLTIEAEQNILPLLTSEVSGGTLRLGVRRNTAIAATRPISYRLGVRELTALAVSGAATVQAPALSADRLTVTLSGSGRITLGGTAARQQITVSGSGTYDAGALASRSVTAAISGSGTVDVRVSDTLEVLISGSGTLTYHGEPTVSRHVSGSGGIRRR